MTRRIVLATHLVLSLGGCFGITSQGKKMQRDVEDNSNRVAKLEQQQSAQIEQLNKARADAENSIEQLQGVIQQATEVVQRNSADVTVQVSELQGKVAMLEGRLAELQYAIEELKKAPPAAAASAGSASAPIPEPAKDDTPADKSEHYAAAYRAYSERDFGKSRQLFKSFIERYGTDTQADNAQYWLGASYLLENRPATALAEFKKVIQNYRGGDAIDETLLDMAEAFYKLRACSDARTSLETLIRTQPSSPHVAKAKQKLKDMKKLDKDYCTS